LADTLVIIPTYNEKENITAIINAVLGLGVDFNVLVVDDGSPDGTADLVDSMILSFPERIFILKRKGKAGLGTAYIAGFHWALDKHYDFICEMDADFSHPPADLVQLRNACLLQGAEVAVGSRYTKGGKVQNWPYDRIFISPTPAQNNVYRLIYNGRPDLITNDNQTNILTDYYPDLLFYAAFLEALIYLKDDQRMPVYTKLYQESLTSANNLTKDRYIDRSVKRDIG